MNAYIPLLVVLLLSVVVLTIRGPKPEKMPVRDSAPRPVEGSEDGPQRSDIYQVTEDAHHMSATAASPSTGTDSTRQTVQSSSGATPSYVRSSATRTAYYGMTEADQSARLGEVAERGAEEMRVEGPSLAAHVRDAVARSRGGDMSRMVLAWGANTSGQLGNGTQPPETPTFGAEYEHEYSSVPGQVHGLAGVETILGRAGMHGGASLYALKDDGTVWAWGLNNVGQLGDGTTATTRARPVRVAGLSGVKAIACELFSAYALKDDGTVWAWGRNLDPSDPERTLIPDRVAPAPVFGFSDVEAIVTMQPSWPLTVSLYGLRSDGTVWAWGDNSAGQLGDGSTTTQLTPVQVVGLTGVRSIAASMESAYAVGTDGTVWAWGDNQSGQLGDGTRVSRPTPVRVVGIPPAARVFAFGEGAYALATDGTLWAWGANHHPYFGEAIKGVLGVGEAEECVLTPLRVDLPVPVSSVYSGQRSTYALATDGSVWAWGHNEYGQLGLGSDSNQPTPAQVPELREITAISTSLGTGADCTLALASDGTLWVWGHGHRGQLGDGSTEECAATPQQVPAVADATAVYAVGDTVFAVIGGSAAEDAWPTDLGTDSVDVNAVVDPESGKTALMHWSATGLKDQVTELLRRGADPNKADADGDSALYYAASNGHADVVRILLSEGGEPARCGASGPALLAAAFAGHLDVATELLDRGDDVNRPFQGATPLMAASSQGDDELVRKLVQYGANLNAEDLDGDTALYYAASKGRGSTVGLLLQLGAKADPRPGTSGQTPLTIAATRFETDVVLALLRAGADAEPMYRQGFMLASPGFVPVPLWAVPGSLTRSDLTVIRGLTTR